MYMHLYMYYRIVSTIATYIYICMQVCVCVLLHTAVT